MGEVTKIYNCQDQLTEAQKKGMRTRAALRRGFYTLGKLISNTADPVAHGIVNSAKGAKDFVTGFVRG